MEENKTNCCTGLFWGFFSDNRCSSVAAFSLGRNMAATSSSVISLSSTGPPAKAAR